MKNILIVFLSLLYSFVSYSQIIFVDSSAVDGMNTGESWENAFTDLQEAMEISVYGQEVWVARGTYYPTANQERAIYFQLKNGVKLIGGFEGNEAEIGQRDWEENPTVLNGDIGIPGDSTDNSYTLIYAAFTDTTTTVDGLYFEHGNADNDSVIIFLCKSQEKMAEQYI